MLAKLSLLASHPGSIAALGSKTINIQSHSCLRLTLISAFSYKKKKKRKTQIENFYVGKNKKSIAIMTVDPGSPLVQIG